MFFSFKYNGFRKKSSPLKFEEPKKVIKYTSNEKFIIARRARQALNFIIKNTECFPVKYVVLKNNIITEAYSMLRNIYKANILKDINDKKEIIVNIEMLNYYLDEALRRGILSKKIFKLW